MYRAPEVARGEPYGLPAEVCAFGMLIYSVWTGQHPFSAPPGKPLTTLWVSNSILSGASPVFPPGTPELLKTLAEKCWDPDPALCPEIGKVVQELQNPSLLASIHDLPQSGSRESREERLLSPRLASTGHQPVSEDSRPVPAAATNRPAARTVRRRDTNA
jgi:hypothetical protein